MPTPVFAITPAAQIGRSFRLLWLGRTTSELGSALVPVALSFAVLDLTGSASALGFVLTVGFVARIALLLLAGVVADRWPRDRVMVAADALRAVTQGTVAALFLVGEARLWLLLVLFALYGAGDAFFSPASTALVPQTVDPGELQRANALLSGSRSLATVVGPALSGLLVASAGVGIVFAVDAASFCVSTATLVALRLEPSAAGSHRGVLAELRLGWREATARTWLWVSIVYFAVSNLAIAPLFVLGPLVAKRSLDGAGAWGLILTCAGIGSLLGDAAAVRFRPRRSLTPGYLLLSTWALAPALLARPAPTSVVCAAAAVGFASLTFSNALWFTALQERIPPERLARVSSYDWLGSRLLQPLGYALAGPAGAAFGVPAALLGGAALHASASVAVALLPSVRTLQRR